MSYATVTDLQDRIGVVRLAQLTDMEDPPTGVPDSVVAERALADASAEIDSYLMGRYALPLASVPAVLRVHCLVIAFYRLLGDRAEEVVREDYKASINFLMQVAQGKVSLLPADAASAPAGVGSVMFAPGAKVMGREATDPFIARGL